MKTTVRLSAFVFAALLALTASVAAEPDTSDIAKSWRGTVHIRDGRPIPVQLKIVKARLGDDAGTIRWGDPYRCESRLEYAAIENGVWDITPRKSNGPFCDSVEGGEVLLKYTAGAKLEFQLLAPKDRKVLQQTTLEADSPPRP